MTSQGMTLFVSEPHPIEGRLSEKLLRPPLNPADPLIFKQRRILRRQGEAVGQEGHVAGEHLLHADAQARAVDGAVYDEQLLAGSAVAVADHAGEVGGAEEAGEILKWGEALSGP